VYTTRERKEQRKVKQSSVCLTGKVFKKMAFWREKEEKKTQNNKTQNRLKRTRTHTY
jgi:hypothetical protein